MPGTPLRVHGIVSQNGPAGLKSMIETQLDIILLYSDDTGLLVNLRVNKLRVV
jgi:hypothetical protein